MDMVTSFPAYFVGYVHTLIAMPTVIYVAVIALFFGLITDKLAGVIVHPAMAAVVFIASQVIAPVVTSHAEMVLPVFDAAFAKMAVALYIVFLVLDTVVFAVKKLVVKILDR